MKQEEILKLVINELFKLDTLHQEYQDTDTHIVVDSQKDGNTLTIKVQLLENKDKKEFENWLQNVDDELFYEIMDDLKDEGINNLEEIYQSDNYKEVINKVKNKAKEIIQEKISKLSSLL